VGPWGANVRSLADDGAGDIFAGTQSGGVYVSTDNGQTWTLSSSGLPSDPGVGGYQTVNGITVGSDRLFACTSKGVYASVNGGASWQVNSMPLGVSLNEQRLFVDAQDSQRLVVQNPSGVFVYEPADSVQAWIKPGGMPGFPVHELDRAPNDPSMYYAVTGGVPQVYRSIDNVHSWALRGPLPGTTLRDLAVDPIDASRLYASTDTGTWYSIDGGASFSRMDDGVDPHVYQFVNVGGTTVALARGSVLSNAADPDHLQTVGTFPYTRVVGSLSAAGKLLFASDMGVLEGEWNGSAFASEVVLRGDGMNNTCVTAVVPVPHSNIIYVATGLAFDGGVYRSNDGGLTWEHRANGLSNPDIRALSVFPGNPDIAYAGTADALDDTGENGSVFKTIDGGLHWTDVGGTIPFVGGKQILVTQVHPNNADVVYVSVQGIGGGMFRTTNGGATWTQTSQGLVSMPIQPDWCASPPNQYCPQWSFWAADFHDYFAMLSFGFDPTNPDRMFLGSGGCWGGPYRSTDGGSTWVRKSEGHMEIDSEVQNQIDNVLNEGTAESWFPVHLELYDMDVAPWDPNHVFATGGRGQFNSADLFGIVYASVDGGNTWSIVRENARSDYFSASTSGMALHASRPRELYVSARNGVHVSYDEGSSWSMLNDGLTAGALLAQNITFDPDDANRLYLGTINAGVWAKDLDPVAVRLTHLDAVMSGTGVAIRWGVTDAVNHAGFYVDRDVRGTLERLTPTLLTGRDEYTFVDVAPVAGSINRYWVVELSRTGTETRYGPLDVSVNLVERLRLGPAVPNPLRGETKLAISGASVTLRVVDASGRRVATLPVEAGTTSVVWKAMDDRGRRVPAGVYFIEAVSGSARVTRRVLVLR
jgi:photosystem II stability/assembly factor-like uncharacterized protein